MSYPKTSFERFGDDLTELILSYLPFADKLRLECVCRQWRRLIFQKQKCLDLTAMVLKDIAAIPSKGTHESPVAYLKPQITSSQLIALFKKSSKVVKVVINCRQTNVWFVIELVFKYCSHITGIHLKQMNELDIINKTFAEKFRKICPKLKSISIGHQKQWDSTGLLFLEFFSHYCHNLTELRDFDRDMQHSVGNEFVFLFGSNGLPKLKVIETLEYSISVTESNDSDKFDHFIDSFPHLEGIKSIVFQKDFLLESLAMKLSRLKHLKRLELNLNICRESEISVETLRPIADNCPLFECLILRQDGSFGENRHMSVTTFYNLLKSIQHLKQLKRLKIIDYEVMVKKLAPALLLVTFERLNCLKSLTHLSLHIYNILIVELILENIDRHLPSLQYLDIRIDFITDTAIDWLAKHKRLVKVRIVSNDKELKKFLRKFRRRCPKIRISCLRHKNHPNVIKTY